MTNNANEGHPGALISQIATYANASLYLQPNIILLMAGTNDINNNDAPATAPSRLGDLLDECISSCPNAVLLVAQLTPILDDDSQARVETFNAAIPGLVAERAGMGKKVLVVDMEKYVSTGELMDGLHPNDDGYEGMARAWYDGIRKAANKRWVINAGGGVENASSVVVTSSSSAMGKRECGWLAVWGMLVFVVLQGL
jgi:lysophospholipase L1-like esterase